MPRSTSASHVTRSSSDRPMRRHRLRERENHVSSARVTARVWLQTRTSRLCRTRVSPRVERIKRVVRTQGDTQAAHDACHDAGDPAILGSRPGERDEPADPVERDTQCRRGEEGERKRLSAAVQARRLEDEEGEERKKESVGKPVKKERRGGHCAGAVLEHPAEFSRLATRGELA